MSAVLDSEENVSNVSARTAAIEIREGDWKAYLQSIARCKEDKAILDRYEDVNAYKRARALAYLGRRAQRYTRYPWLRSLMNLLTEIEQIQDQISSTNVITLVPSSLSK